MALIYKILPRALWDEALAADCFKGAPVDLADGYIHFSTSGQVKETAAKHFSGQSGLLLAAFDAGAFGNELKWEPSRGGDLFPHLYASLSPGAALWVKELPIGEDGVHQFPELG